MPWPQCIECDAEYDEESGLDRCRACLESHLSEMTPKELGDVPGPVLALFNLKPEYFRD